MVQPLANLRETPSQTAGPYVHIGCIPTFAGLGAVYPEDLGKYAIEDGAEGKIITIIGSIYDGAGWAFRDAMFESWQCDAAGKFPGQAPHIALWIVPRGINTGLQTRIYFEDEDNESDPVLSRIEQRNRVETLIARKTGDGAYRFDIYLQGEKETVFLDM